MSAGDYTGSAAGRDSGAWILDRRENVDAVRPGARRRGVHHVDYAGLAGGAGDRREEGGTFGYRSGGSGVGVPGVFVSVYRATSGRGFAIGRKRNARRRNLWGHRLWR